VQKNFKITKQLEKYMGDSINEKTLSKAKEKIWRDINSTILEMLKSIEIIF